MDLNLSKDEKKFLIYIVRKTIADKLKIDYEEKNLKLDHTSIDNKLLGNFVTLHIKNNLRGCIGYIKGIKPFIEQLKEVSIQSAFHDPRFPPLSKDEFNDIKIEITILSPFQEIKDLYDFIIGEDGLYLQYKFYSGLFLPQVATEQGWNKQQFLENLTYKAGLYPEILKNKEIKLFKFKGYIISEDNI
ncbi:MAG: AmmeMemoRadiSam system protein A [Spirochaetes bacterium]|nr:AmmeMemoRadiSam system protein A [Spirochaetota bacterium]